MRIAVIADVHGNLPALETVLDDVRRRGTDKTINLGDCVSGPLWPREVCNLLMASQGLTIRGNHDRSVSGSDPDHMGASDKYACLQLRVHQRQWLGALPASAELGDGIIACHGTPTDDNQYLVEDVSNRRRIPAHWSVIQRRLGHIRAKVVLCGHSHQQHLLQIPGGPTIVNPGSVGRPAYHDARDDPHGSESGSPHARYAMLDVSNQGVAVEMIALTYDWAAASTQAERNGQSEWAYVLWTGFIPNSVG